MLAAPSHKKRLNSSPSPSAQESGIGRLVRWHLTGLGLLAALSVSDLGLTLLAWQVQVSDGCFLRLEAGLLGVTLLTALAQGARIFQPGRVRRAIEEQRAMEARTADQDAALAEADKQVEEMRHVMEHLSALDALTGLKNHRAFQEQLESEMGRALRYGHPLSLLIMDLDRFKAYNEAYGHPKGDHALRHVADLLKENARTSDIPARFGGEEFAVILTETDMMGSVVLGERLRQAVAGADSLERPLTASIGIATLRPGSGSAAEMIAQADRALCAAKGEGRNRVSHAHRLPMTDDEEMSLYSHAA